MQRKDIVIYQISTNQQLMPLNVTKTQGEEQQQILQLRVLYFVIFIKTQLHTKQLSPVPIY